MQSCIKGISEFRHINVSPEKVGKLSLGKRFTGSLVGSVGVNAGAEASSGRGGG